MNIRHYLEGALVATLLSGACSKKPIQDRGASGQPSIEVESSEEPPASSDNMQRDVSGAMTHVGQPAAGRVDFYSPCDGKKAGDDCVLMLGMHEARTKCVTMLDEANQLRLSCGERRPPSSRRSEPPRIELDFFGPCEGKKIGEPCVLKQRDPEMRSYCRTAPEGSVDQRLSCGILPPAAAERQ